MGSGRSAAAPRLPCYLGLLGLAGFFVFFLPVVTSDTSLPVLGGVSCYRISSCHPPSPLIGLFKGFAFDPVGRDVQSTSRTAEVDEPFSTLRSRDCHRVGDGLRLRTRGISSSSFAVCSMIPPLRSLTDRQLRI